MNTVTNNQISEDYFLHRIKPEYQEEANVLLATTGVLNSLSGKYTLVIISCTMEPVALSSMNHQHCLYKASVVNQDDVVVDTFNCKGSPNQCFEYFVHKFELVLAGDGDKLYLKQHDELIRGDKLVTEICQSSKVAIDKQSSLLVIQEDVDEWINTLGVRYFSELTNLSNLIEEVGEVARLIGREYGEQSFKKGEKPECIKAAIADELSDVLFILVCLSNQLGINLDESFIKNINKKTKRDTKRHELNEGRFSSNQNYLVLRDDKANHFTLIQQQVDNWIEIIGKGYFNELTNLSNLIEEVGEVARLIGRGYGEQSFKKGEEPACLKTAIADELLDVLFIVVCLANQLNINLDDAFVEGMNKRTNRDSQRHKNNDKLIEGVS